MVQPLFGRHRVDNSRRFRQFFFGKARACHILEPLAARQHVQDLVQRPEFVHLLQLFPKIGQREPIGLELLDHRLGLVLIHRFLGLLDQ